MLAGSLDTFSVSEVLSLLGASGTTGALQVWTDDEEGQVFCHDGAVSFATVGAGAGLGDILIDVGLVTADRWAQVVDNSDPRVGLAELFGSSSIDAERLDRFFVRHIDETIFELDRWTSGEFRLDVAADHPLGNHFTRPMATVLESLADRERVWVDLLAVIGSIDRIVHQAPMDHDDTDEMRISRTQLKVISHVDGRRSIRELSRHLRIGLFDTARTIADLLRAGIVVLSADRSASALGTNASTSPAPAHVEAPTDAAEPAADLHAEGSSPDPLDGMVTEFVEPGEGPARDLLLRLLSAVKEEL